MTCISLTLSSWNVKSIHHPAKRKKYCLHKNGKEKVEVPLFRIQTRQSSLHFVRAKVDVMEPNQF